MRGSTAGMSEGMIGPSQNIHTMFLTFVDVTFSSLILAPLIVLYWRGTWNCMDHLLTGPLRLPGAWSHDGLASLAIGIVGHLLFTAAQRGLTRAFHPDRHRIAFLVASRAYTYVYGIVCVNGWRGGWQLLGQSVPLTLPVTTAITLVAVAALVLLKGLRNISATPFAVATDHSKDYFVFPTMFKKATEEPGLYILDCMFSVLVIGSLVVFVWRGAWIICDLLIYPDNFTRSSWASMVIGYAIVAASFCMQSTMRWLCEQLTGLPRLIAADIFLAFSFVGTVNVWRGVWNLCDVYFIPDHKFTGDLLTHSVPFVMLALLNCSNSVLVRGVYIDAEEPAGQCVIFPVYYVRLFFQKERTKKQQRQLAANVERKMQSAASAGLAATTTMAAAQLMPLLDGERDDEELLKRKQGIMIVASGGGSGRTGHETVVNSISETTMANRAGGGGEGNNNEE